jgi:hypothetical protein
MLLKLIELVHSWWQGSEKMRGGKNEGIFHYVVENTCRKNVRNRPFHYVDEKKGSYTRISIILMKRKAVVRRDKPAGSRE